MKSTQSRFIHIPGGTFFMGLSDGALEKLRRADPEVLRWIEQKRFDRERPDHKTALPDFRLAADPVTVGQYRRFVGSDGYSNADYWSRDGWDWRSKESRATPLSWDEGPCTEGNTACRRCILVRGDGIHPLVEP